MAHLQQEDYKLCQELLKKAELFTEHNDRIRAITYNNYACLFRKTNKLRNALQYLEQALDLEYSCINSSRDQPVDECLKISNPCEIHLNICAILSQMDKHELALHHAMKALILIQDELVSRGEENPDKHNEDRYTVLVIALHNISVEHEYLKQYSQAISSYKKARDFSEKSLGIDHMMTKKMDQVYYQATSKIHQNLEKQHQRKKGPAAKNLPAQFPYSLEDLLTNGLPLELEFDNQFKGLNLNTTTTTTAQNTSTLSNTNGQNTSNFGRQQRSPTRVTNPYVQFTSGGKKQ
eukprot:403357088